jgi:hypothetical protein
MRPRPVALIGSRLPLRQHLPLNPPNAAKISILEHKAVTLFDDRA